MLLCKLKYVGCVFRSQINEETFGEDECWTCGVDLVHIRQKSRQAFGVTNIMGDQFVVLAIDVLAAQIIFTCHGNLLGQLDILRNDANLFGNYLIPVDLDVAHLFACLWTDVQKLIK